MGRLIALVAHSDAIGELVLDTLKTTPANTSQQFTTTT